MGLFGPFVRGMYELPAVVSVYCIRRTDAHSFVYMHLLVLIEWDAVEMWLECSIAGEMIY